MSADLSPTQPRGRSVLFDDCFPTRPPAGSERWSEGRLAGAGQAVLFEDCEPASAGPVRADVSWLWPALPELREWVRVRARATADRRVDVEAVLLNVAAAVVAERPDLGPTPPAHYLRSVAERVMLSPAA